MFPNNQDSRAHTTPPPGDVSCNRILSECVTGEDIAAGRVYPPLANIRTVSHSIASEVGRIAEREGLARALPGEGETWEDYVRDFMWTPDYQPLIRAN